MKIKNVTVFGHADYPEDAPEYRKTFETTKLLAEAGYTIVDGGGPGIMKAATMGAKSVGGHAIGVTLYPSGSDATLNFEGRDPGNEIDEEVKTGTYLERTLKLIELGDVYLVMNGGTGTVSEFGMAWGLARLHFGCHKHLILYGSWWHQIMEAFAANMKIREEALKVYHIVDEPHEVLDTIRMIEKLPDNC